MNLSKCICFSATDPEPPVAKSTIALARWFVSLGIRDFFIRRSVHLANSETHK